MAEKVKNAILLAALALFGTLPMFQYQLEYLNPGLFIRQPDAKMIYLLALSQSVIVFSLAVLSSLVGFLYASRLRIPGFGEFKDILFWMPKGILTGLVLTPFSYFFLDKALKHAIPEMFPNYLPHAVSIVIGSTISQEIIARFGLMTIGIYFLDRWNLRNRVRMLNTIISGFSVIASFMFFKRFDLIQHMSSPLAALSMITIFSIQWVLCHIYYKAGLLASIGFHFGLSIKFIIYSLLLK